MISVYRACANDKYWCNEDWTVSESQWLTRKIMKYGRMKMLNLNGNTKQINKAENRASQKQQKTCLRPLQRIHPAHGHCGNAFWMSAGTCSSLLQTSSKTHDNEKHTHTHAQLLGICLWQALMQRLPWSVSWKLRTVQTFTKRLNHLNPKGPKGTRRTGSFTPIFATTCEEANSLLDPHFALRICRQKGLIKAMVLLYGLMKMHEAGGSLLVWRMIKTLGSLGMLEDQSYTTFIEQVPILEDSIGALIKETAAWIMQ